MLFETLESKLVTQHPFGLSVPLVRVIALVSLNRNKNTARTLNNHVKFITVIAFIENTPSFRKEFESQLTCNNLLIFHF